MVKLETTTRSFRIASYNVLADSYVKSQWYPKVDPENLRWDKRKFALAERVAGLDADIVCLQEVEADAYALLAQRLGAQGYDGIYSKKGCSKPDGCAIFFRPGGPRFAGRELINDHFKPDQEAYAWIVCGDLNVRPDNPVVRELISSGFIDAYTGREQATCNPNGSAKRIDYIFYTAGLKAKPAKLMKIDDLTPLPSAEEPSDHLPLAATFEKK